MSLFHNDKQSIELFAKESNAFAIQSAWNRVKLWDSTSTPGETDCLLTIHGKEVPCSFVCTFVNESPYFTTTIQVISKSDNTVIGLRTLTCHLTAQSSALFTGAVKTEIGYEEHGIGTTLLSLTNEFVTKTVDVFPELSNADSIRVVIQDNAVKSGTSGPHTGWTKRRMQQDPNFEQMRGSIFKRRVK